MASPKAQVSRVSLDLRITFSGLRRNGLPEVASARESRIENFTVAFSRALEGKSLQFVRSCIPVAPTAGRLYECLSTAGPRLNGIAESWTYLNVRRSGTGAPRFIGAAETAHRPVIALLSWSIDLSDYGAEKSAVQLSFDTACRMCTM